MRNHIKATVNANSDYWQIPLDESQLKRTFYTPFGRFCHQKSSLEKCIESLRDWKALHGHFVMDGMDYLVYGKEEYD